MPNLINELTVKELEREFKGMGSCVVVGFDKLPVKADQDLRSALAAAGFQYLVVKNRLALRALQSIAIDAKSVLKGKCGLVLAKEEDAIGAAKLLKDVIKKKPKDAEIQIRGGILEGRLLVGKAAEAMADLPDRQTMRTMLAMALAGPARALATVLNQVGGSVARGLQAHVDKGGAAPADATAPGGETSPGGAPAA